MASTTKSGPSPRTKRPSMGATGSKASSGPNGVALAPPVYGISVADQNPAGIGPIKAAALAQLGADRGQPRAKLPPAPISLLYPPPPAREGKPIEMRPPQPPTSRQAKAPGADKIQAGQTRVDQGRKTGEEPVGPAPTPALQKTTREQPIGAAQRAPKAPPSLPTTPTEAVLTTPAAVAAPGATVTEIAAPMVEVAPGRAAGGAGPVKLLMPEPPAGLTAEEQAKLDHVQKQVNQTAAVQASFPPAEAHTEAARSAVKEPAAELQARSQNELIAALDEQPQPSPQIIELCEQIRTIIAAKRPPDEQSLLESDFKNIAKTAGNELNQSIETQATQVESQYAPLAGGPTGPPQGQAQGQGLVAPPESVPTPDIQATSAAPKPIPTENLSLQADVEASQQRINAAGMNSEVAQQIQTGPVAEARAGQVDLQERAAAAEAAMLARQDAATANAQGNMANLQTQALQMLIASRRNTIQRTGRQQTTMVSQEEAMREQIGNQAQSIFSDAQLRVTTLMKPLSENAMTRWNTGVDQLSQQFKARLAKVDQWKKERYEGISGGLLELWDDWTGAPDWVKEQLDLAEKGFGDGVCRLLTDISVEVNTIIGACEKLIANARRDIDKLFQENLPKGLEAWAESQRALFQEKLDGLHNSVTETRTNINGGLVKEAAQAVQAVRDEIYKRREEAKGKLEKIADAIAKFIEDPVKAIINGLLSLAGIAPASFWAVVDRIGQVFSDIADDPLGFADKLLSAIGKGFEQFFDNFGKHILSGFWEWLFSGLGALGIQLPSDFSLKSIVTFILQLLGISWARIRKLLAKHIGEKNVALIEKAWAVVSKLIEKGPEGIFELIKEQLNPKDFVDQILNAAIDFMISALIKQVTVRVALLFNPVGAIVQAVMAIYKVLKWIFTNAARIFSLIETVVSGMAALIAGDIGGMVTSVEKALARLIAPVISFIADLVGLGDLPDKIAKTIQGFHAWIEGILDRVIGWLAEQGRKLLAAVGLGKKEEPGAAAKGELGAVGDTISFQGGGESHRLWIREKGTSTTVMVASTEESVGQKLAHWKSQAHTLGKKQGEAEGLIAQALPKLDATEKDAYETALAKQQAESQAKASAAPAQISQATIPSNGAVEKFQVEDQQTVEQERSLAQILTLLFDLFEEDSGEFIYKQAEGNHTVKIRRDLAVFRFPGAHLLTGEAAQKEQQKALESIVSLTRPDFNLDTLGRAAGPAGHVKGVKETEGRESLPPVSSLPGGLSAYQPRDQRGHLIGDRFYGPATSGNLVPMHQTLNLSTFKTYENSVADAHKVHRGSEKGVLIHMSIQPRYPKNGPSDPSSFRPETIIAVSKIVTLKGGGNSLTTQEDIIEGDFENPGAILEEISLGSAAEAVLLSALSPITPDTHRLVNAIIAARPFRSRDDFLHQLAFSLGEPHLHLVDEILAPRLHLFTEF